MKKHFLKVFVLSTLLLSLTTHAHTETTCRHSWESCGPNSKGSGKGELCCPCSKHDCNTSSGCTYKDQSCQKCNTCACYGGASCLCGSWCSSPDDTAIKIMSHPKTGKPIRVHKTLEQSRQAQ